MTSPSSFTATGMAEASRKFEQGAANITGLTNILKDKMTDLESQWGGQASKTFQGVFAQWISDQRQIVMALEQMAQNLGVSANEVHQAEDAAAKAANQWWASH